ncbi:hypothetical protein LTR70_001165 [Exophiala xenobiotica]|uniref:NACHT domain-containing protein n=1 Tax=Lithohypha guttulata TaxID=1690604 RepID=A0ABR0K8A4_9EURO|nr:hypothetical protein LTR24_005750 [Lithohypha guttulata]KAK5328140.1 hypothetical protein LTR70_001165 [Exophiala xenobiotica]
MQDRLYQSLLYQVLSALPLTKDMLQRYKLDVEHVLVTHLLDKTVDIVVKVLENESLRVLLLVDGLDETDGNVHRLIESVKSLQQRTGIRHAISMQAALSEQLITKVLEKAEGVFMYASYCADSLIHALVRGYTEHEAWQEIDSQPGELGSMYDRIFERVPAVCRAEVAMILRLLESAVHQIRLALLFRVWLYIAHRMKSSNRLPLTLGQEQFKMRLQGILTGLVQFRDVQPSAADDETPETFLDQLTDPTKWLTLDRVQRHNKVLLPPTKRVADARFQEIRLSHETLRMYLRQNKLIDSWLDPNLLVTFPNHIWVNLYSDVLIASNRASNQWGILREVMNGPWRKRIKWWTHRWLDGVLETMILHGFISFENCLPTESCGYLLLEAASNLVIAAKELKDLDKMILDKVSRALHSPFVLLDDFKQASGRWYLWRRLKHEEMYYGIQDLVESESWSLDLAYAASKQWFDYLCFHKARLAELSDRERNYIVRCCFFALVVVGDLCVKPWVFSLHGEKERIVNLLLEHGEIRSPHIAIYLESVAHVEPPQYLQQHPASRDRSFASVLAQPHVITDTWEWWPFLKREGMHLLEIWARLPEMSGQQYATRLRYLTKIGIDVRKYRHRDESNIVMLVVDACKGGKDFGNLFAKLGVLVAAHADLFWQLDERRRTAMWKVRDMVRYVKRCMQVRMELEEPSNCWNEVRQFELLLDKLEADRNPA